ncbi:MAG: OmpA family protein [Gemmatimonadota bacterium]
MWNGRSGARLRRGLAAAVTLLAIGAPRAGAQEPENPAGTELARVEQRLLRARHAHLDLLSPRHYDRAAERLADARDRLARGRSASDVLRRLREAEEELDRAESVQVPGSRALGSVLEAREAALAAGAPERSRPQWENAEKLMLEAGRKLEDGNLEDASERGRRAETEYREAELNAIRAELLGVARQRRSAAVSEKAAVLSPETFGRADSLLRAADAVLVSDRTARGEAGAIASVAAAEFAHATWIALAADSVAERRLEPETLVLRDEEALRRVAAALGIEPDFSGGIGPVADRLGREIRRLRAEADSLGTALGEATGRADSLRARIGAVESELSAAREREAEVAERLRQRERRERTLREARAVFSPDEAEVLLGDNVLILRLYGLTFPSGSDEIGEENRPLLTKLERVIRQFPGATISVEGHTDSRGDEEANLVLSRRRAVAVREYLLTNVALSADRISSLGLGETRPIATNDTEEGRARNRRIEVTLTLGDG